MKQLKVYGHYRNYNLDFGISEERKEALLEALTVVIDIVNKDSVRLVESINSIIDLTEDENEQAFLIFKFGEGVGRGLVNRLRE